MTTRIGFIGLGRMGEPMATNVIKAGFDLMVYDIREEPLNALRSSGALIGSSPRNVGERSEIIEIAVVDDAQVEEVLCGERGVFEGARPGAVVAVHSTVSPATVTKLGKIARSAGINLLEAPVSGGQTGAVTRKLCYMVGGDREVFERCRPVFSTSGSHIFHVGEIGAASIMKLIQQVVVCVNMLAAHEAEILCSATGIDPGRFLEVLHVSSGQSFVCDNWLERFKRPHDPITIREHRSAVFKKSLSPALELAERLGVCVRGASLAHTTLDEIMGVASKKSP